MGWPSMERMVSALPCTKFFRCPNVNGHVTLQKGVEPLNNLISAHCEKGLQLRKRPHPTHLHRRVRHVKSRLLRRVGVVRGPAHSHQGVTGLRIVVEGDGGERGERPSRAQWVAGRVARFVGD